MTPSGYARVKCNKKMFIKKILGQFFQLIFVICERILQLCDCTEDNSPAEIVFDVNNIPFTQKFVCHVLPSLTQKDLAIKYSFSWTDSLTDSSLYDISKLLFSELQKRNKKYLHLFLLGSDVKADSKTSSPKVISNNLPSPNEILCESPEVPSCSSNFHGNFLSEKNKSLASWKIREQG